MYVNVLYSAQGGGVSVSPLVYTVTVTNTGAVASDVVVLGFLTNPPELQAAPKKELFNFARLRLVVPGQTRTVRLSVPAQVLSQVDELGTEWLVEGEYGVHFGVRGSAEGEVARSRLVLSGEARAVFTMP